MVQRKGVISRRSGDIRNNMTVSEVQIDRRDNSWNMKAQKLLENILLFHFIIS